MFITMPLFLDHSFEKDCRENERLNLLGAMTRTRGRVSGPWLRIDARAWWQRESFRNITYTLRVVVSSSAHLCENVSRSFHRVVVSCDAAGGGEAGRLGFLSPVHERRLLRHGAAAGRARGGPDRDKTDLSGDIRTKINRIGFQI
ncbi:hypothetical protein [Burkholderia catarinensis]|uniref:hypothetical protein n=1 Tax=Burkholderia catarinensis TaxID=1108140 RepID=UPI001008382D|nr:hypothetical protein [Burkholderia catarinensis]